MSAPESRPGTAGGLAPRASGGEATPRFRRVGGARIVVVGIAECKITSDPRRLLLTYALGSCVGVSIWNRQSRSAGLLHAMLPDSALDRKRAAENPFVFVDTGMARLFEAMRSKASSPRDLVIKVAGGASLIDGARHFHVGRNNVLAVKSFVERNGLRIEAADVGGAGSRTMQLQLLTGRISIRRGTREVGSL